MHMDGASDMTGTWVTAMDNGLDVIEYLDGVSWADAPAPPRWHKHWAQTRGFVKFDPVHRCPCGAIRRGEGRPWFLLDKQRVAPGIRGFLLGGPTR